MPFGPNLLMSEDSFGLHKLALEVALLCLTTAQLYA